MLQIEQLSSRVSALQSNEEVINYVKTHPGTMGIIGLNWISDQDDPTSMAFMDGLKVASIYIMAIGVCAERSSMSILLSNTSKFRSSSSKVCASNSLTARLMRH